MTKLRLTLKSTSMVALLIAGLCSCESEELAVDSKTIADESIDASVLSGKDERPASVKNSKASCRSNYKYANDGREKELKGGAVNVGKVDDRTCYNDYYESVISKNKTVGNYEIGYNSNHTGNKLQPRIERSLQRTNSKSGSYLELTGQVRILEVGDASSDKDDGTYILQTKGKHAGSGKNKVPKDPAICLYLVKPTKYNEKGQQIEFTVYREQIKDRGTSRSSRELVELATLKKGHLTTFNVRIGFKTVKRNGKNVKIHYVNTRIGKETLPQWEIPNPNAGQESGIRYGAYRVKGGKARIQWYNTKQNRVQK